MNDYSISRSPIPIVARVLSMILVGELAFAASIVLIALIRDTLSIDATLAGLAWLLFTLKTSVIVYYVGRLLIDWLRVNYFVISDTLIIARTKAGNTETISSPKLTNVYGANVYKSRLGRFYNYGNITVEFPKSDREKPVVLRDVVNPERIAANISQIRRKK